MSNLKRSTVMKKVIGFIKALLPDKVVEVVGKRVRARRGVRLMIGNQKIVIDRRMCGAEGVVPVIYWDGVENFGDSIGPYLVSKITGKAVLNTIDSMRPGLMTVGSILQLVDRQGIVVWGSGLIERPSRSLLEKIKKYQPKILTVRGYETASCLQEAGLTISNMDALGDPGVLMPLFYKPKKEKGVDVVALCPHYMHKSDFIRTFSEAEDVKIVDVQRDLEHVVDEIASSNVCISTSLHGIIMSQAYGVPWVWLEVVDNNLDGDEFKFNDFFTTLRGDGFPHVRVASQDLASIDIKALAKKACLPEKKYDEELILKALRRELHKKGE